MAATRRRIVEATLSLHDEQGITATSLRRVAARAGVSPGTVLNHFPRMDDLIAACGRLSDQLAPMPTSALLIGHRDPVDRLRAAAEALFTWYELLGEGWDHLQVDRRTQPQVDAWLRSVDAAHRTLVADALGLRADTDATDVGVAVTSIGSWRALRDVGYTPARAAARVTRLLDDSLELSSHPASKGPVH